MITKTKPVFTGLLLVGIIGTQAQASWLSNSWNTMPNGFTSALSTTKSGFKPALSATKNVFTSAASTAKKNVAKHSYIAASALVAPIASYIVFKTAKYLYNRHQSVPFQIQELDDSFEGEDNTNQGDTQADLVDTPVDTTTNEVYTTTYEITQHAADNIKACLDRVSEETAAMFAKM